MNSSEYVYTYIRVPRNLWIPRNPWAHRNMDFPGLHGFLGVCGFLAWDLLIPLEPMGGNGFYRFIGIDGFPFDLSDSSESMGSSDSKESSESVGFR